MHYNHFSFNGKKHDFVSSGSIFTLRNCEHVQSAQRCRFSFLKQTSNFCQKSNLCPLFLQRSPSACWRGAGAARRSTRCHRETSARSSSSTHPTALSKSCRSTQTNSPKITLAHTEENQNTWGEILRLNCDTVKGSGDISV